MKKYFLVLTVLLSTFSLLNAQCVINLEDSLGVYCGGSVVLQSSVSPAGIISPTTNTLNQIVFFDQDHAYIAGENGTILRSTDGGQTWDLTTFLPDDNWRSVNFTSQTRGFIVSVDGKIAKTTDGGISWNVIYDDPLNHFTRIKFIDSNTGLAIGDQGLILKTTDGGNSWNTISSGTSVGLNDIAFVNGEKGFIGGNYDYSQNKNILLTTSDAGDTWSNSAITTDYAAIYCMAFSNESTGYISGNSYTYKTTDGGITWAPACWPASNGIALWNDSTGFLCMNHEIARFFHSGSDQDILWDNSYITFNDVTCPDNQSVFAVGSNGTILSSRPFIADYHWEPSTGLSADNVPNPVATPNETTKYTVTVQLSNGNTCSDSVTVAVFPQLYYPKLCMLTVDSATSHNRIIWNKPVLLKADSVYVLKEGNISGQFTRLAAFPASQPGDYIDEQSDPLVKAETYAISVLDKCSFEYLGSSHTTMHLSINQGIGTTWNLNWQQYSGAQVFTYNIYRWSVSGNPLLIASVSGSISQYTDLNAPAGDINYMIEAVLDADCSLGKSTASSFSNIARFNGSSHGVGDVDVSTMLSIDNNPVTDRFAIITGDISKIATISLLTLNGKQVREWKHPAEKSFYISDLPSGIYLLKVEMYSNHQSFMRKLVKL